MKSIALLFTLSLTATLCWSQNVPIDYEKGGHGASWSWTVFENETNPPLEIISNPAPDEVNGSATVAQFTALQAGNPWAGTESLHGSDIGSFFLDASNSTVTIMVWKSVISDVGIKLVRSDNWSTGEIKIANTLTNQWEEMTFDMSSNEGQTYDQIVIFPDFDLDGRDQDNVIYFDNVNFSDGTVAVAELEENATSLYPNPTDGNITIASKEQIESISIYNLLGELVLVVQPRADLAQIDLSALDNGVYMVETTSNGVRETQRLIKE